MPPADALSVAESARAIDVGVNTDAIAGEMRAFALSRRLANDGVSFLGEESGCLSWLLLPGECEGAYAHSGCRASASFKRSRSTLACARSLAAVSTAPARS